MKQPSTGNAQQASRRDITNISVYISECVLLKIPDVTLADSACRGGGVETIPPRHCIFGRSADCILQARPPKSCRRKKQSAFFVSLQRNRSVGRSVPNKGRSTLRRFCQPVRDTQGPAPSRPLRRQQTWATGSPWQHPWTRFAQSAFHKWPSKSRSLQHHDSALKDKCFSRILDFFSNILKIITRKFDNSIAPGWLLFIPFGFGFAAPERIFS